MTRLLQLGVLVCLAVWAAPLSEATLLGTTLTKTVILETDTHCYKTFPLAKPCKGKGSGKGLKDKFSKGKGRALWIDAGPIVGRDGSVTVGSEAAMNALIKPTRAKAKGDDEENLPQVSFAPAMTRRDPRFCCDYFYTSTSRYTMTVITATTTVKLLCKPSTYCFDACEKKGLDKFDKFALDGLFGGKDKKGGAAGGGAAGGLTEQISHFRRRPRPAVDYLDSYFATPTVEDDYYYDDEYEDIYAAVQYQKALARKRAKAAQASMRDMGKEAAEKAQAAAIAARRHETAADAAGKSLKISESAGDQVSDANWQDDLGLRMLENMGQGMVPHLEGLGDFGALVEKSAKSGQVAQPPVAAKTSSRRASAARKSDAAAADDEGDVWDKLLNGGLSQSDVEWVRIKSFMDEKKKK